LPTRIPVIMPIHIISALFNVMIISPIAQHQYVPPHKGALLHSYVIKVI